MSIWEQASSLVVGASSSARGTARKRRLQANRSEAGKVRWLIDLVQTQASHQPSQPGLLEVVGVLRAEVARLRSEVATIRDGRHGIFPEDGRPDNAYMHGSAHTARIVDPEKAP